MLKLLLLKLLTPYLNSILHELAKNLRQSWHLCLHFVLVVLCSEPFSLAATLEPRKDRNDQLHLYDRGLKLPIRNSRVLLSSKWRQISVLIRVQPGIRVFMSCEPDCSLQVRTVITLFWNFRLSTRTYLWWWLFTYVYFVSCPSSLST
jgi:hypothetical protein